MARPSVACPSLISTNRAMSTRPSSTSVRTSVCRRSTTVVSRSMRRADDREQALALPLADPAVDVQAAPHVAADVPLRRRPAVEHPPVVAVRGAQPVLDLERPAVRGGAHAAVVRPVGRMDPVLPGQAQVGVGLGAGELQPAPVDEQPLPARPVSPDERGGRVGHRPEAALGLATRPAERHPAVDACPQLAGRERGDEVVVGAGAQTLDGGLRPGAGRHEHHRHQGGARVAAQRGQQVQAAQPRQGDVGEHEVGRVGHGGGQCGRPVRHGLDAVRAAEEPREVGAHVRVVVDHQDAARVRVVRHDGRAADRRRRPPGSHHSASVTDATRSGPESSAAPYPRGAVARGGGPAAP